MAENPVRTTVVRAMQDFYREYGDAFDWNHAEDEADAILAALRSLPVEQRMAAMGMEPIGPEGRPYYWLETRRG